jgi:hypothetical protein
VWVAARRAKVILTSQPNAFLRLDFAGQSLRLLPDTPDGNSHLLIALGLTMESDYQSRVRARILPGVF